MPDPIVMMQVAVAAALVAAAAFLYGAWPWRSASPAAAPVAAVLGVALGFYIGCWLLGVQAHWPAREDQERLLFVLLPVVIAVELTAAAHAQARWLDWVARCVVAGGAAWVILYHSSYLTDLAGPGSREWAPAQAAATLAVLGAALAAVWSTLTWLMRRRSSSPLLAGAGTARTVGARVVPLAVACACAGATVSVMYSGNASGGQLGLPLAAAAGGTVVASLLLSGRADLAGVLGVALVGLFALVVAGHFFGKLTTLNAALLFGAPLLCGLVELPFLRRLKPARRSTLALLFTAVPVVIALTLARQQFQADSAGPSPDAKEGSVEDYQNFGK
jgi:hypothetical protein